MSLRRTVCCSFKSFWLVVVRARLLLRRKGLSWGEDGDDDGASMGSAILKHMLGRALKFCGILTRGREFSVIQTLSATCTNPFILVLVDRGENYLP